MTDLERRLKSWERFSVVNEEERQRVALLRQPPAKNPEHLTRLVKIKRIGRGFIGPHGPVAMGETVRVSYACARELVYLHKAILVDEK
jgi:hypothetical protein